MDVSSLCLFNRDDSSYFWKPFRMNEGSRMEWKDCV